MKSIINDKDVIDVVRDALLSKVGERLNNYNSPLNLVIDNIIKESEPELADLVKNALLLSIKDKQFVANVNEEFKHKVAKTLVGKMEGSVEKAADKLRNNPAMRARMIIAIEEMIKE